MYVVQSKDNQLPILSTPPAPPPIQPHSFLNTFAWVSAYDGPDSRREFSQSIAHLLSTHVLYLFSHHPIPNSLWIPFLPFPTFVFAINNYNNNVQWQKRIFAWNICFHKLVIKTRCIWTDECLARGLKFRIKRLLVRRCWSAREEAHGVNEARTRMTLKSIGN